MVHALYLFHHPSCIAIWAETSFLATKSNQFLMLAVIAYYAQKSVFKATALKQILQTLFLHALAVTSLDVKAAP
ncbi:MAG: hypothetical protein ACI9AA_002542 [Alteromonas sp.]